MFVPIYHIQILNVAGLEAQLYITEFLGLWQDVSSLLSLHLLCRLWLPSALFWCQT